MAAWGDNSVILGECVVLKGAKRCSFIGVIGVSGCRRRATKARALIYSLVYRDRRKLQISLDRFLWEGLTF